MKKLKILLSVMLVVMLALSCVVFMTACGEEEEENAPAVMTSEDGKYDLYMNSLGRAWITEHGSEEKLVNGNCKVREENSALTLSFEDEIVSVNNYRLTYEFEYANEEAGVSQTSFSIHRGEMMKALGLTGVVLDTMYDDPSNPDPDVSGGGMFGVSLLMSAPGSGSREGYGKLEIKILKIQGSWDYKYTKEDGLVIDPTDAQKALVGPGTVTYDEATETYLIDYDVPGVPPMVSGVGQAKIRKVDIENALMLS